MRNILQGTLPCEGTREKCTAGSAEEAGAVFLKMKAYLMVVMRAMTEVEACHRHPCPQQLLQHLDSSIRVGGSGHRLMEAGDSFLLSMLKESEFSQGAGMQGTVHTPSPQLSSQLPYSPAPCWTWGPACIPPALGGTVHHHLGKLPQPLLCLAKRCQNATQQNRTRLCTQLSLSIFNTIANTAVQCGAIAKAGPRAECCCPGRAQSKKLSPPWFCRWWLACPPTPPQGPGAPALGCASVPSKETGTGNTCPVSRLLSFPFDGRKASYTPLGRRRTPNESAVDLDSLGGECVCNDMCKLLQTESEVDHPCMLACWMSF
eukprot:581331-Pelagomonas_calceolata.AAC.4